MVLWRHQAYGPDVFVATGDLASESKLTIAEVVAAATGLVTNKYIILPRQVPGGVLLGYYLAAAPQVEDAAEMRRERARRLMQEAGELEKLAKHLEYDERVAM
jgi:hypothetical protein